jgi:hypothetical protein
MTEATPYISGAFALAGVIVGAATTQLAAWWERKKRHLSYWSAMAAETELCRDHAAIYVADWVIAPLYRFPTTAYENGFPALLGEGAVTGAEAKAALTFYGIVEQINRGIEQANDALVDGQKTDHSVKESNRVDLKCKGLVKAGGPYDAVRAVVAQHIKS